MKQKEGKTHGYTWEFFKECIELEFIPKNANYISRCKLSDLVNETSDNLCQYVKAYSELMFEIRHMHELNCVPFCDGALNLDQAQAWRELAHLIIQSHHENGRLFGCGMRWKVQVQEGE